MSPILCNFSSLLPVTRARSSPQPYLSGSRELLYLDLALEDVVRSAAERAVGRLGRGSAQFMAPLLQNLALSVGDNAEVCYCLKAWNALPNAVRVGGRPSQEEALQAVAVLNRIRRALSDLSDRMVARLAPISRTIGNGCGIESWAVSLFAEEVVRGGPAFAISLAVSSIEPDIRSAAALGAWQVISPATASGRVVVVKGLHEVMNDVYQEPTVLVADHVRSDASSPAVFPIVLHALCYHSS